MTVPSHPGLRPAALVALAMLAAALAGCQENGHKEAGSAPIIRPVRTVRVEPVSFQLSKTVTGIIEARADADLGFRIAGKLVERTIDVGARVKAGDVLARLDGQDQRNALQSAQAMLASAKAEQRQASNEEERKRSLLANGNTTRVEYDAALLAKRTADARVVAAEATRQAASDQLGYTELKADRDGVVMATGAEPGQVLEAGAMVVRVARPEEREAVFNIAEAGLQAAPRDPVIEVALVGDDSISARGRVREVSPQADPVTRTHTVRITLENPPDALRLGATVTGRLVRQPEPVIELPRSALYETAGQSVVWVVDPKEQTVRPRPVTLRLSEDLDRNGTNGGEGDGGPIFVSSGLSSGDIVLTAGVRSISEGQRVRLDQPMETAAP
ncbi:MAG: efflux RND transporter periplasmic adaptor subunit [Alphaproteobacteria bacterium]